ncbi:hypothetical protein LSAT2_004101 [Lamellibrachia satsuma]|nr:hypothetical protein LSAT2_004101 [Lamellibrachia satsuma]
MGFGLVLQRKRGEEGIGCDRSTESWKPLPGRSQLAVSESYLSMEADRDDRLQRVPRGDRKQPRNEDQEQSDSQTLRIPLTRPGALSVTVQHQEEEESSAVKFSGLSFLDPNKYFNIEETKGTLKKYEDYMKGKDVSDNNIKDGVRQAVALSEELDTVWKSRGGCSLDPGPIFATNYDHTVRGWYQSALAHRDVTVLTPPYVDALGNGIVLSLCRALYQSRDSGTHSTEDTVVGVIAMDFKLANIKEMLAKLFKACDSKATSCFLVDTSGYLVYHDDFIKPDNKRLVSVHIAEKEVNIANDLIRSEIMTQGSCLGIITKKTYNTWQIKRNAKVNELQDRSLAYSLEVVPETNVFLGVKKKIAPNALCKSCPDNTECNLRWCEWDNISKLNGQTRCQCPCYLDANFKSCKNVFGTERDRTIPCTPVEQHVTYPSPVKNESEWAATFPSCYETDCTGITIKSECLSYNDCDWCNSGTQPCRGKGKCPIPPDHYDITKTSQRHHKDTTKTSQRHHIDTTKKPQIHHKDTTKTPQRHHKDTTKTSQRHYKDITKTSQRHYKATKATLSP